MRASPTSHGCRQLKVNQRIGLSSRASAEEETGLRRYTHFGRKLYCYEEPT